MSLDKALTAAKAGKTAEVLKQLLKAWRELPTGPVTAAIDDVAKLLEAEEPPIHGKPGKEIEAAWQARAKEGRPESLGLLLSMLLDTKGSGQTLDRLITLVARETDPRLAKTMGQLLEAPPYNGSVSRTLPFWKFVYSWLPKLNDPRLLVLARTLPATWEAKLQSDYERTALNSRLKKAMPELEKAYGEGTPTLSPAEAAKCKEIVETARRIGGGAAATKASNQKSQLDLLREVYERPEDDGPRLVLSDLLQEQGDPRGEFIALQFLPRPTVAQTKRMAELQEQYGRAWLGNIAALVMKTGLVFERGFPVACRVKTLDTSPEWSTLKEIHGRVPDLDGMHLGALRTVASAAHKGLERVPNLEELQLLEVWFPRDHEVGDRLRKAYGALKLKLKRLVVLTETSNEWGRADVPPSIFDWVFTGPGSQLDALTVPAPMVQLGAWRAVAKKRKLKRLTLRVTMRTQGAFSVTLEGDRLHIDGKPKKVELLGSGPAFELGTAEVLLEGIAAAGPFEQITVGDWKPDAKQRRALGL